MKIQIDPTLRNNPFEFVEFYKGKARILKNDNTKKLYFHGGFNFITNIHDLPRFQNIISNFFISRAQQRSIDKCHSAALPKN